MKIRTVQGARLLLGVAKKGPLKDYSMAHGAVIFGWASNIAVINNLGVIEHTQKTLKRQAAVPGLFMKTGLFQFKGAI